MEIEKRTSTDTAVSAACTVQSNEDTRRPRIEIQADEIEALLVSRLAEALNVPADQIDVDEPFSRFGLDSPSAIALSAELEDWLGVLLSPTLPYDYPTIRKLSVYLAGDFWRESIASGCHTQAAIPIHEASPAPASESAIDSAALTRR